MKRDFKTQVNYLGTQIAKNLDDTIKATCDKAYAAFNSDEQIKEDRWLDTTIKLQRMEMKFMGTIRN
jgi:hypothetical protein